MSSRYDERIDRTAKVVLHHPRVGRTQTGLTSIAPARPVYGTTLSCSCGERWGKVSNEAPSKGGKKFALSVHAKHVAESPKVPLAVIGKSDPGDFVRSGIYRIGTKGIGMSRVDHISLVDHRYGPHGDLRYLVPLCGADGGRFSSSLLDDLCKRCETKATRLGII